MLLLIVRAFFAALLIGVALLAFNLFEEATLETGQGFWTGLYAGAAVFLLGGLVASSALVAARLWPASDPETLEHEHPAVRHQHLHVHDEHHQHEHEGWEGPEPHRHSHRHAPLRHSHRFVIDLHHQRWPT